MDLLPLAVPPAFGFVIGFATNALAIRMLFRPYREVRILGLRFHGMIPRRKADIAATVSRTVVSELLKESSVAERLGGPEVRGALQHLALELLGRFGEREYGTLEQTLGLERGAALEEGLLQVALEASDAVQAWLRTPEGVEVVRRTLDAVLARSPAELLRGDEELAVQLAVGAVGEFLAAPDLEARVRPAVARALVSLASADASLGSLLPEGVRAAALAAVGTAVPALLRRFEEALLAPANVGKIKAAVRAGIESYLLETEGGLVKNLVRQAALMGRARICREADEIVDANIHRLGELVYQEENRARVEDGMGEALDRLLARTPAQVLASLPAESLDRLFDQIASWACGQLRRRPVTEAVSQLLQRELAALLRTPLHELVRASGAEEGVTRRWAHTLAERGAGGGVRTLVEREAPGLIRTLLRTPVGRPARYLPRPLLTEVTGLALDHLMPVISAQVPAILDIVDVQGLIEREILGFSPEEVENVILSVARRELRSITWWGGILGALVGGLQSGLALLGRG